MIDPLLSLSFNLNAQKGTYALLIGSGVSRSAGIPTGWEVTLDLISKLAHLQSEDCGGDVAGWYSGKFGKEPDYSEVLEALASTSAAQQQLLKPYFEPSEQEREEGKKLPTPAHKAIARLVRSGHVRVLVTTNFDRLLEAALEAEGIAPVVIASSDAARGAPPLVHSKCTVIKVHGDYLDHRIKNSPEALAKYDRKMERLLSQVFDEYGLIICGWSGEYDVALRKALKRTKPRRYPLYWTSRSEPKGVAKNLIAFHGAHFVKIDGADPFFESLVENVETLEEFDRPHPVSTQAAIVTLKRYLSEERFRIQLRDFLVREAEEVGAGIDTVFSDFAKINPDQTSTVKVMHRLEAVSEKLLHLFANGSFYAKPEQTRAFVDALSLVASKAHASGGQFIWINLRKYPSLLVIYAAGISAISSENYSVLCEIASREIFVGSSNDNGILPQLQIYPQSVMEHRTQQQLIPDMERHHTPLNDYLCKLLREPMRPLIPDNKQYERAFDGFEYLWGLLHLDARIQKGKTTIWIPRSTFFWRRQDDMVKWFRDDAKRAAEADDSSWPPVHGGLFGGSAQRFSDVIGKAEPWLDDVMNRFFS